MKLFVNCTIYIYPIFPILDLNKVFYMQIERLIVQNMQIHVHVGGKMLTMKLRNVCESWNELEALINEVS